MKIKIIEANKPAIESALKAVNGKASSFALTTYARLAEVAQELRSEMDADGLTLSERAGATLWYRPSGPSANKYKYSAASTMVCITMASNGKDCFLTEVRSQGVNPKQSRYWMVSLKAENKATWLARVAAKYGALA